MFTGIIEELGQVKAIARQGRVSLLSIKADKILDDAAVGDSVSVNGVCLTIVEIKDNTLVFEVMPETLKLTNLNELRSGDRVNLERSLKAGERLSGHFVSGHVDTTGVIRRRFFYQGNLCFEIAFPSEFAKYCVEKGSIAVDGISLTVAQIKSNVLRVYIIPHTLKNTILSLRRPPHKVNLEFDILFKRA